MRSSVRSRLAPPILTSFVKPLRPWLKILYRFVPSFDRGAISLYHHSAFDGSLCLRTPHLGLPETRGSFLAPIRCPKWLRGRVAGREVPKSAKTRNWEKPRLPRTR